MDAVRRPEEKQKLAEQLFEAARSSTSASTRFVLLQLACELAAGGGDMPLVQRAVGTTAAQYTVDHYELNRHALMLFAAEATTPGRIGALVEAAGEAIRLALVDERYDEALELASMAYRACQPTPGKDHRKAALDRRTTVQRIVQCFQEFGDAQKRLAENSEDPEAHLTVGRWYCLVRGEWEKGLPHLAAGSDEQLRLLAERELVVSPSEALELGDQYWEVASARRGDDRDALLLRAAHWYRRAEPITATGLLKAKITKRLEELADLLPLIPGRP